MKVAHRSQQAALYHGVVAQAVQPHPRTNDLAQLLIQRVSACGRDRIAGTRVTRTGGLSGMKRHKAATRLDQALRQAVCK